MTYSVKSKVIPTSSMLNQLAHLGHFHQFRSVPVGYTDEPFAAKSRTRCKKVHSEVKVQRHSGDRTGPLAGLRSCGQERLSETLHHRCQMELCVFKRRPAGVHIINLGRTLETLLLAARCIASIEYPGEMFTSAQFTPRSVLKFAHYTEATLIAGHFTNQIHPASREPQLLIETDPLTDHQPVVEASYAAQVRQLCHPVQHQVAALGRSDVVPVGP
ncbi:40S ribosomal protein sa [Culex quinquefasciatus]|uniref:40S ribosomal protein SA n=1 Tax=Culex quinquefasciatus TaxID=7176 RepID=B0X9V8_CULQU|nr:40S ribosomal protein sa [Culex quinquefasciatus]|eukprot:XP_001866430.1 40S ribosomal protein sa [Culex quinquefasciatus]